MYTSKQYLNKECTHDQYYLQFVTPDILRLVSDCIGVDRIKKSTCPHLNDIPLNNWDGLVPLFSAGEALRECGDYPTMCGKVCILKAAANKIRIERE